MALGLNRELADELRGRGKKYTILLGGIFALLKSLAGDATAVRMLLWLVSQRDHEVRRNREWLRMRLVAGAKNRTREEADRRLDEVLRKLADLEVITGIEERAYARKPGAFLVINKTAAWHLARRPGEPR
ncbi:MAG: hypothetical protein HY906_04705 [Deltaproteobacteria bacterium]|nr:hypothetical protein [Deltaproteobacteria bacterium]